MNIPHFGSAHAISMLEWLIGFTTVLTGFLALVLLRYLWQNRFDWKTQHYRIAFWFVICCIGAAIRNGWIWVEIVQRPELVDFVSVQHAYPIIGAWPWALGTGFAAVGILALCAEFGRAYVGRYTWIPALVLASTIPLFSIWYVN